MTTSMKATFHKSESLTNIDLTLLFVILNTNKTWVSFLPRCFAYNIALNIARN